MTITLEAPVKTKRKNWTQVQVAHLVRRHLENTPVSAEETAKLVELGLVQKPGKPSLTNASQSTVEDFLASLKTFAEPQRTLSARYAIKALTALLPKKVQHGG